MPAKRTPQPTPGTFADRLNRVWSACRVPKNKAARDRLRDDPDAIVPMDEPSYEEVSDFVIRTTGKRCSAEYLGMLRRGKRDNPTIALVDALAVYFRVHRDELLGPSAGIPAPAGTPENGVFDRAASLSERLDRLYHRPGPNGQPVTDAGVAQAIGENEWLVCGIRTGQLLDVQISVLRKLALHFGVPVEYFVADEGEVSETVDLAGVLRNEGAFAVALRVLESPDGGNMVNRGFSEPLRDALKTLLKAADGYDKNAGAASGSPESAEVVSDEKSR